MRPALLALLLAACQGVGIPWDPDLERMETQAKAKPFAATPFFANGAVNQAPPDGTIPREQELGPPDVTEGGLGDTPIDIIPIDIDRAGLETGRGRFTIYCAACHGVRGDGDSEVAKMMTVRRPPSLVGADQAPDAAGRWSDGRIFRVMTRGWGFMPSYAHQLSVEQRWQVVAYVRALQLAANARLDTLPPPIRDEATKALEEEQPEPKDEEP